MAAAKKTVVWTPGKPHPQYNVVAADEEGMWVPAPGYVWADDPPEIEHVIWRPGIKHPTKNLVAGDDEGQWVPPPGYTFE